MIATRFCRRKRNYCRDSVHSLMENGYHQRVGLCCAAMWENINTQPRLLFWGDNDTQVNSVLSATSTIAVCRLLCLNFALAYTSAITRSSAATEIDSAVLGHSWSPIFEGVDHKCDGQTNQWTDGQNHCLTTRAKTVPSWSLLYIGGWSAYISLCHWPWARRYTTQSVTHGQSTVTFPASERHRPLTCTKLYCSVTEAQRCK